jgi:Protein of unknown function (DUF1592)/Protein of unknown function (DUF1588)/Protein of unknown function (DUF1585)
MRTNAGILRLSLSLSLCLAIGQAACLSNDRLLVGENGKPDGSGTGGASSGSGGSGGVDGTGGAGNTINRLQHPLPIAADQALTRMAALIWKAPPDGDLLSQAAAGHFVTIEDLYGPARQMLADPRAAAGVGDFYNWWLHLEEIDTLTKDPTLFPEFTSQLAADMHSEVLTFALKVTLDMNGTFETLLGAPFSFVNARLAAIYGLSDVTGDNLQQANLNSSERAGLLTMPGLQAQGSEHSRNDPPRRGKNIVERMICRLIPPPPPGVSMVPPPTRPGTTLRQELVIHQQDAVCGACHRFIDSWGLAFETFDAIGRARTTDNGSPIDVTNLTLEEIDPPRTINNGPIELAAILRRTVEAQTCMAQQWLAYALKTDLNILGATTVAQAFQPFKASGFNLKELIAAVVLTDAFLKP